MSSASGRARRPAHVALREATAECHARLDALFAGFDLADRAQYGRFLTAHAAALIPLEAQFRGEPTADPRSDMLRADLAALGLSLPAPLPAPQLSDPAMRWGAAYVVEGSRLGGALLARRVAPLLPRAYLAAPQPPGAWRKFLEKLANALYTDDTIAAATRGALAAFGLFEQAGRQELG